ncbi:uncharacterized protein ATNIH1004_001966 [Aspergillus tanneri]|uniref:Uncharacterized protein n=1 Tax=Aspergillus tanneri TaxID=1220188 RepID=A0A5M9M7Q7_9EURO|nr:uncharacterized protein ATNIH1004_001966 [Aspergillus tanneri]KAA8641364.1 hypothetical protein ATNIH1004_001966 [Aspergillus tanneri]
MAEHAGKPGTGRLEQSARTSALPNKCRACIFVEPCRRKRPLGFVVKRCTVRASYRRPARVLEASQFTQIRVSIGAPVTMCQPFIYEQPLESICFYFAEAKTPGERVPPSIPPPLPLYGAPEQPDTEATASKLRQCRATGDSSLPKTDPAALVPL